MARYAHASDFGAIADCFSRQEASRILGVPERTIARWRNGGSHIPWAAFQLLYEHSRYGLAERDAMEGFQRNALAAERDALRARVAELEAAIASQSRLVDWGCANDPFIHPDDPRSKVLVDAHNVML